jgi:hypothetical protein
VAQTIDFTLQSISSQQQAIRKASQCFGVALVILERLSSRRRRLRVDPSVLEHQHHRGINLGLAKTLDGNCLYPTNALVAFDLH